MFWQRETAPNYDLAVDKFICSNSVIVSFDFNHVLICVNACFFLSIYLYFSLFLFPAFWFRFNFIYFSNLQDDISIIAAIETVPSWRSAIKVEVKNQEN